MIYEDDKKDLELYKDKSNQQNRSKEYSGIFIFVLIALVAQMLILNPTSFNNMVKAEVKESYRAVGHAKWLNITEKSNKQFKTLIVDSGFKHYFLDKISRDTEDTNPIAKLFRKLTPLVKRFANNIQVLTYQIAHRINLLNVWLYTLIPFGICQLTLSVYQWRIRGYAFGNKTKAKMTLIKKTSKLLFVVMVVYFALPCFFPLIGAFIPLILLVFITLLANRYIVTMQKHW